MTPLCAAIVRDHQARKSRAQKAAFRELVRAEMRKEGVFFREERAKGLIENVNLVYGNIATAEFVFGAHYDTCAELPFPNLAAPLNIPLSILMQLLLMLMLALPAALGAFLIAWLGAPVGVAAAVGVLLGVLASALVIAGKPNRHTMNDNTSGVVALLTLLARLPKERRGRVAVVLFDNEEVGLIGSTLFRRRHARVMANRPLVNLDCVGDGEMLLLAPNKGFCADEELCARTQAAFFRREPCARVRPPRLLPLRPVGLSQGAGRGNAEAAALFRRGHRPHPYAARHHLKGRKYRIHRGGPFAADRP